MLVIGGTGPVDAACRRPSIDGLHTARGLGALVRPYVKWDDQPASAAAATEALLRATLVAMTQPQAEADIQPWLQRGLMWDPELSGGLRQR